MKEVHFDPGKSVEIQVASRSPHVVAYRLWSRELEGAWRRIGEGHTEDDPPQSHRIDPLPKNSEIAWWLGIGGNPGTSFRALVTFGQDGVLLDGGTCLEEGRTNDEGVAQREGSVTLV